jgi:hypothetical protein
MNAVSISRWFGFFAIPLAIVLVLLFLLFPLVIGAVVLIALVVLAARSGFGSGG